MFFSKAKKGFTLIELLVVIAIIGILAGIVLVSLSGARASARDARRQADIDSIKTAMELFYNDNNAYLQQALAPTIQLPSLNPVPKDPSIGASYGWVDNSSGVGGTNTNQSYCAYAVLEKAATPPTSKNYFVTDPKGPRQIINLAAAPATTPCN